MLPLLLVPNWHGCVRAIKEVGWVNHICALRALEKRHHGENTACECNGRKGQKGEKGVRRR